MLHGMIKRKKWPSEFIQLSRRGRCSRRRQQYEKIMQLRPDNLFLVVATISRPSKHAILRIEGILERARLTSPANFTAESVHDLVQRWEVTQEAFVLLLPLESLSNFFRKSNSLFRESVSPLQNKHRIHMLGHFPKATLAWPKVPTLCNMQ